jgi:hypothetical protein
MRTRIALWGAAALLWVSTYAAAQDRIDRLEQRLDELEREVKSRDQEIARLQAELARRPVSQPTTDEIEKTKQEVLSDIESRSASPLTLRTPASFNPHVAVIIDALGTWSNQRSNDAYNRFDVREAELDLRAAIDPRADGVLVLAFERDVHNPPFPEDDAASSRPRR